MVLRLWRSVWVRVLLGLAGMAGLAVFFYPMGAVGCSFYEQTGWFCPGCGMTRALRALVHGEVVASLKQNLLLLPGVVLGIWICIKPRLAWSLKLFVWMLSVAVAFTVARNTVGWLAPM